MAWFKRKEKNITTPTESKKDAPEGVWYKTLTGQIIETDELKRNAFVSIQDGYHVKIGSKEYYEIIFDDNQFTEINEKIISQDPLEFEDTKKYKDRLIKVMDETGLKDSIRTCYGKIYTIEAMVCVMDFNFIGGSMGSVLGEKIRRAVDFCIKNQLPMVMICKSGGARMQEAAISLMQLAKIQIKLSHLADAGLPYITLLTDPTFGGVTASFGSIGDVVMAEPGALIGFAGPRVIKETIGKDLPEGFQSSEFLLEKGFVDMIVPRHELKKKLSDTIRLLMNKRGL
jgi:acetyl-CoA carboxylase carboxyl transferase subunit beta